MPAGKGSWEYRFFSRLCSGAGSADVQEALSRARAVTGVDLSSESSLLGLKYCFLHGRLLVFGLMRSIAADAACRLPGLHAETRSDVYLISLEKGSKKIGMKARDVEHSCGIQAGAKGANRVHYDAVSLSISFQSK
jgi:hypothetical protein